MGKVSKMRFIIRSTILIFYLIIFLSDKSLINVILNKELIFNIKTYHLIWMYLIIETLCLIIPSISKHSYSGKLFKKHYIPVGNYDKLKLIEYTYYNNKIAYHVAIWWFLLNINVFLIYYYYNLDTTYVYLVFLIYYWCDMFCINMWCPFNKLFFRNRCCNECRIYNWDHIFYATPLILIKSFWTYSIVGLCLFLFLQWEYMIRKYPERFSPISNKKLRCANCNNKCRFNKNK